MTTVAEENFARLASNDILFLFIVIVRQRTKAGAGKLGGSSAEVWLLQGCDGDVLLSWPAAAARGTTKSNRE